MKPIPYHLILDTAKNLSSLNKEMTQKISDSLGLTFINENEISESVCFANTPEVRPEFRDFFSNKDLLNYFYGVLYAPNNNETNLEFLKIDFPNELFPTDKDQFWKMVEIGKELLKIHLLENDNTEYSSKHNVHSKRKTV